MNWYKILDSAHEIIPTTKERKVSVYLVKRSNMTRYNGCHDEKLLCNQLTNCHDIHSIDITKHGCVLSRLLSRDKSMVQAESKNEGSKCMLRNYRTGKPQANGDLQSLINGRCTWRSNLVNGTINMRVNVYSFLYIPNAIPVPLISLLRQQQHHNAIPQYHLHTCSSVLEKQWSAYDLKSQLPARGSFHLFLFRVHISNSASSSTRSDKKTRSTVVNGNYRD